MNFGEMYGKGLQSLREDPEWVQVQMPGLFRWGAKVSFRTSRLPLTYSCGPEKPPDFVIYTNSLE